MTGLLEFTLLGCGYSGGVPRSDGEWGKCDPAEPRNRRSRCSLLVRRKSVVEGGLETTVLVDTSPDLRQQAVAAAVTHVDAVLYTHEHADQTHGIDDLRGFYLRYGRRIPCHMDPATHAALTGRFDYVFDGIGGYPAICDAHLIPPHGAPWAVEGPSGPVPVTTFHQAHGEINSVGYRFGDVAYSPDVSDMPEASFGALAGLKLWIIDALREAPHPSHLHLDRALEWIARVRPARAVLTNMFYDLDYASLSARVPAGVEVGYDGMRMETPI
jgi:phosphoribosyl 1,2-cyclic phosphate phosphodiesterase